MFLIWSFPWPCKWPKDRVFSTKQIPPKFTSIYGLQFHAQSLPSFYSFRLYRIWKLSFAYTVSVSSSTAEAFVGKGFFKKRVSYHSKGRSGVRVRPECRLTVVLREITPEEEAEIARLKVNNFTKLTKRERRLVPHKLIETTPIWNRKGKTINHGEDAGAMAAWDIR